MPLYPDDRERLDALVDAEIAETRALRARGMTPAEAYAMRVERNLGTSWGANGKRHGRDEASDATRTPPP